MTAPQATPCPRAIPEFRPAPGSNSDEVDRQHQAYIRETLLPILVCYIEGTVPAR